MVSVASSDFDDDPTCSPPYRAYGSSGRHGSGSLANDLLFEQDVSDAEALLAKAEREPTAQSAAKAARERRAAKQKQDALKLKQEKLGGRTDSQKAMPPPGPLGTKRGKAAQVAAAEAAAASAAAAAQLSQLLSAEAGEGDSAAGRRAASAAVSSLQAQVHDLKRALEEGDGVRDGLRRELSHEQARHATVEGSWRRTCTEIEAQMESLLLEKEASDSVVAQRDAEVEQLCLELEDREARIDELKLMLKKLLETANSSATQQAALGGGRAPLSPTRQPEAQAGRASTRGKAKSTKL
jgi:DNA repair exonuclease SbcCD ATPase subunit